MYFLDQVNIDQIKLDPLKAIFGVQRQITCYLKVFKKIFKRQFKNSPLGKSHFQNLFFMFKNKCFLNQRNTR